MASYPGTVELIGLKVAGKNVGVPLKSSSVRASLNGYVVGLESTLKYVNEDTSPLEVLFRFPVDQSYAVVGLEAVIAGKRIKAQLKEKEEAKQEYDVAISSGFTAAFAEEKSGDIFSISLGNLPPKAEAELDLKLVGELPIDAEGAVRFSLPAVLKPRYSPLGSADPLAPVDSAAQGKAPAVYSFDMVVRKDGVASVTSPTHTISDQQNGDSIRVTLVEEDAKPLDKDLIILVHRSSPHLPSAVCELGNSSLSQRSFMGAPAVMLSFFPEFESNLAACEFVFLVDRSGSMRGSYIRSAGETLVLFLRSLPPGCTFNIIGFGSHFTSLFPNAVKYDQENLDVAIRHAENLQADLGGTELLSPLQHIFRQRVSPGLPHQVFVLTDGSVSNIHACFAEVTKNVANSRVFTFGIGSGASTALVNGLAKAGNGTAEFIKEGERMQPKVIRSLKRALQPSVTDVGVEFQLTSGFEAFQAPAKIATIFKGDKIVVYGIFKSKAASDAPLEAGLTGTATLKGQILDMPIVHSVSFEVPPPPSAGEEAGDSLTGFDMPVVHHLAAKSLLSDWSNGLGWSSTALTDERKEEIIKLSLESSVICEHTAFVAFDVDQTQPIKGAVQVWDLTASLVAQQPANLCGGFGCSPFAKGAILPPAVSSGFHFALSAGFGPQPMGLNLQQQQQHQQQQQQGCLLGGPPTGQQAALFASGSSQGGLFGSAPPTGQQAALFGAGSSQGGVFGSAPRPPSGQQATLFTSGSSQGGLFGSAPPTGQQAALFGSGSSQGGVFGSAPPPTGQQAALFTSGLAQGGLFGSRSLMGQQAAPGSSLAGVFGSGPPMCQQAALFTSGSSQTPGLFGSASPAPPHQVGLFDSCQPLGSGPRLTLSNPFSLGSQKYVSGLESSRAVSIISLQQAAGFWSLKAVADQIIKKDAAQNPPQGVSAEIWATVLALAFLEICYAGQKDEWELIAMKAETWLASQTCAVSIASLMDKAKEIINS